MKTHSAITPRGTKLSDAETTPKHHVEVGPETNSQRPTLRHHVHFLAIGDEVVAGQYRTQLFGPAKDYKPFYESIAPSLLNQTRLRENGRAPIDKPAVAHVVSEADAKWLGHIKSQFANAIGGKAQGRIEDAKNQLSAYFHEQHLAEMSGLLARPYTEVADITTVTTTGITLAGATSAVLYNALHSSLLSYPSSGPLVRNPAAHMRPNHKSGKHNAKNRGEPIPEAPWMYNDPEEVEQRRKDADEAANAYKRRPVGPRAGGWQSIKDMIGKLFAERVAEADEWPPDHWARMLIQEPELPYENPHLDKDSPPSTHLATRLRFRFPFRHNDTIVVLCGVMAGAYDAMTVSTNQDAAKLVGHNNNNNQHHKEQVHSVMGVETSLDYLTLVHEHCMGYFYHRLHTWVKDEVRAWDLTFATPPKSVDDPRIKRYLKGLRAVGDSDEKNIKEQPQDIPGAKKSKNDRKKAINKKKRKADDLSPDSIAASSLAQLGIHVKVVAVPMETTSLSLDPLGAVMSKKIAPVMDSPISSREIQHCLHRDEHPNPWGGGNQVTSDDPVVQKMRNELGSHAWMRIKESNEALDASIARGALHERLSDLIDRKGWNKVYVPVSDHSGGLQDGLPNDEDGAVLLLDDGAKRETFGNVQTVVASDGSPPPSPAILLFGHPIEFRVSPLPPPSFRAMLQPSTADDKLWMWSDCLHLMPDGSMAVAKTVSNAIRRIVNAMVPMP